MQEWKTPEKRVWKAKMRLNKTKDERNIFYVILMYLVDEYAFKCAVCGL